MNHKQTTAAIPGLAGLTISENGLVRHEETGMSKFIKTSARSKSEIFDSEAELNNLTKDSLGVEPPVTVHEITLGQLVEIEGFKPFVVKLAPGQAQSGDPIYRLDIGGISIEEIVECGAGDMPELIHKLTGLAVEIIAPVSICGKYPVNTHVSVRAGRGQPLRAIILDYAKATKGPGKYLVEYIGDKMSGVKAWVAANRISIHT